MTKIQLRHDTSTRWQTANPILASGEVGVETDTQKIKVGNGINNYNSLSYVGNTIPSNMVTTNTNQTISGDKTFTGNIFSIQPGGYQTFQTTTSNVYIGTSNSGVSTYAQVNLITSESGNIRVLRGGASGTPSTVLDTGNFSTSSPTGNLKYWTGIETDYTAISTKDPDTLYRTTDTNKVFLGTIQLGG